jgi:hypothetical protein
MIRQLFWGGILLLVLGPGVVLAQPSGSKPPSSAPAPAPSPPVNPPKPVDQEGENPGIEARNPLPGYALAVISLGLVLTIVCMPSRKG